MTQTALKYEVEVSEGGRLELDLPFPSGARVTVFVIREPNSETYEDLVLAAGSSLNFWDNPWDDEDWNASSADFWPCQSQCP